MILEIAVHQWERNISCKKNYYRYMNNSTNIYFSVMMRPPKPTLLIWLVVMDARQRWTIFLTLRLTDVLNIKTSALMSIYPPFPMATMLQSPTSSCASVPKTGRMILNTSHSEQYLQNFWISGVTLRTPTSPPQLRAPEVLDHHSLSHWQPWHCH